MDFNFASKKKTSSSKKNPKKAIEAKVLQRLPSDATTDSVQVMVTEVSCTEPDCVPLETLVICIGMQARWADKVLKPIAEVTESDLDELDIPDNWTEWIQSEKERKAAKNDVSGDGSTSGSGNTDPSTLEKKLPETVSAPASSTLVTMRPRTDQPGANPPAASNIYALPLPPPVTTNMSASTAPKTTSSAIISTTNTTISDAPASSKTKKPPALKSRDESLPTARHSSKGVRQRGCPCCGE